jgi:hypothetical protein
MSKAAVLALLDEIREESTEVGNRTEKRSIAPPDLSVLYIKLADAIEALVDEVPDGGALPYKVFAGLISQSGTSAPTLEATFVNELGGDITFSRGGVGNYKILSDGLFTNLKTAAIVSSAIGGAYAEVLPLSNENEIVLNTNEPKEDGAGVGGRPIDSVLFNAFLEIRIYE